MATTSPSQEPIAEAFDAGRRAGLAVAAVALGVVTFLSLLGLEKAGLAIILGVLALRGRTVGVATRRLAMAAIGLGTLFVVSLVILLVVYWDRLAWFIRELQKLS
jgi:hypothetical protein